jgi:hypothetical protein
MRKVLFLSVICHGLLLQGIAFGDPQNPSAGELDPSVEQGLSERLDTLFNNAIEGGLLQAAGSREASLAPAERQALDKLGLAVKCGSENVLDFSDLAELNSYSDLMAYAEMLEADTQGGSSEAALSIAKGYLALGLYAESRLLLQRLERRDSEPLIRLADFLEGRAAPDISYIRNYTDCYPDAQVWLAAALLSDGDPEGSALMAKHLTDFRNLPLQLRTDVTALSVPELDREGERDLAHKMLASFSVEEAAGASRLQFSQSLLQAGEGHAPISELLDEYMRRPEYRAAAAAAMLRYGQPVPKTHRDALLDELVGDLSRGDGGKDAPLKIKLAVEQMSALSDYSQLTELTALPGLQSPQVLSELRRHLASALKVDLASGEPLRTLAVIEVLLSYPALVGEGSEVDRLYEAGLSFAIAQDYQSLATELARRSGRGDDVALQAAKLAFRTKDKAALYKLSERHSDNLEILKLAVLAAIEHDDHARIAKIESDLPLDADTIVPLIEADAISGNWVLPYAFYLAAGEFQSDADRKKIQKILDLRRSAHTGNPTGKAAGLSHASDVLESSAGSLAALAGDLQPGDMQP